MKIAVVGGYGVGMTMRVDRAPEAGETVSGAELSIGHGGKGSNQAVAAARLGATTSLLTAIGRDAAGQAAQAFWNHEGVSADHVLIAHEPSMTGFIVVDAGGENRITIAPGALEELDAASVERFRGDIREADLLLVSLEIPLATAAAALRIAREEGTRTLLNPAPATELPDGMLDCVDILTPNRGEAALLLGSAPTDPASTDTDTASTVTAGAGDPADVARRLQALFDGTVVLTAGGEGVYVNDGLNGYSIDALRVEAVVDTTGAGDSFTAALAVALAEGQALPEAVRFAAAAGAHAVTIRDVIPSLPTRAQLESLLTSVTTAKEPHRP